MKAILKALFLVLKKEFVYLFIIALFTLLSSRALFHSGFFRTIDDVTTVRIMEMALELKQSNWLNNFPVRWSSDLSHQFGYPLFLFYSSLTYYAGAFITIITKVSNIGATKIVYVFPLLSGPFIFYFCARQKLRPFPSLVATVLYTLFPYRGYDTYIRGAAGEAWAMMFLPGIFAGIFLMEKNKKNGGALFSLFLALLIISHNLVAVLSFALIACYGLFFHLKNKKYWLYLLLGLGLSAFYWIPSIFYLNVIKVSSVNTNSGNIVNFLNPFTDILTIGFPYDPEKKLSGMFTYLLILVTATIMWRHRSKEPNKLKFNLFWPLSGLFILLILTLPFRWFWELTLPISRMFQYPWRILSILSLILPLSAGFWISMLQNRFLRLTLSLLIVAFFLTFLPTFKPREYSYYYEYTVNDSATCATTTWDDEYLPIWVKKCPTGFAPVPIETSLTSKLDILDAKPLDMKARVQTDTENELIVNKYYFPGWGIFVDGKSQPLIYDYSEFGIFKTHLTAGSHDVNVKFSKTWIMWFADILSVSSLAIGLSILVKNRLHQNKKSA